MDTRESVVNGDLPIIQELERDYVAPILEFVSENLDLQEAMIVTAMVGLMVNRVEEYAEGCVGIKPRVEARLLADGVKVYSEEEENGS